MRKIAFQLLGLCMLSALLHSCGGVNDSDYNPDIGPFDKNGNYVEAWADNPPKKRSSRRSNNAKPQSKPKQDYWAEKKRLAKLKKEKKRQHREAAKKEAEAKRRKILAERAREKNRQRERLATRKREFERAKEEARSKRSRKNVTPPRPSREELARLEAEALRDKQRREWAEKVQADKARQRQAARKKAAQKPKPKSKPRVKPKAKPKPVKVAPKFRYHRVKSSDTLYGLSRRYGKSISAIKKANGLRSNTIITGSTLKIPR